MPQCLDDKLRPGDVELGAGPAVCADDDDSRSSSVCDMPPLCRRRRLNKCPTRKLLAPSLHHDAGNVSYIIYAMLSRPTDKLLGRIFLNFSAVRFFLNF